MNVSTSLKYQHVDHNLCLVPFGRLTLMHWMLDILQLFVVTIIFVTYFALMPN